MKKKFFWFFLSSTFLLIIGFSIFFWCYFPIRIVNVSYEVLNEMIITHIKTSNKSGSCSYQNVEYPIINQECSVPVLNREDEIMVQTKWNSYKFSINPNINEILDFSMSEDFLYLVIGEKRQIDLSLEKLGNPNLESHFFSENENIVRVSDNILEGVSSGNTQVLVTVGSVTKSIKVVVTDLIHLPKVTNKKDFLKCGMYSEEDNKFLDELLSYRISKAGYQTRAGVVAALRFLTLEFPYKISYFFENGRLHNNTGGNYVDGEGRFYHKGLYLHPYKYKELVKTRYGPATWGCPLTNWQDEAGFIPGVRYPNGLDCSGFITWAMFNGGYDPKDTGAGDNLWTDDDLSDLGRHEPITMEMLTSGKLKAGDIIATDGHIAMVGGIHDGIVYVAESTTYWDGVVMHPYSYQELVRSNKLTYVIFMDEYYLQEGNYTSYWE